MKEGHRDSDGWEDFEDMWRLNDASPRSVKRVSETPRKSYAPDFDHDDSFDMSIVQEGMYDNKLCFVNLFQFLT